MGNCLPLPLPLPTKTITPNLISVSKKTQPLPIQTSFSLPSPLPSWPSGGGFANGTIDLGGLQVSPVSTFTKVWASSEGGPDNLGATFFTPSPIPPGFSILGSYAQPNNKPLFGWVLVAKDTSGTSLAHPLDYTLVWSSSTGTNQVTNGYFWLPIPPNGYKAVGHFVTGSPAKPALDAVRCVRDDLTDQSEADAWVWGSDKDGFNVHALWPTTRGVGALGVYVGTFMTSSTSTALSCLKNKAYSNLYSSMPNPSQINALMETYSPWIYFHPDETYLPSSVPWFFTNGALLYQKDNPNPIPVDPTGSNLPQGGTNDGAYWLDLPAEDPDKVKHGDLASSEAYLHIKPMLGGTFTDIAIWVFYPFNGSAKAKVEFFNIPLGKIGEHVGDWEHMTLRISNFNGVLWRVFFSEHSAGTWVDASQLEFHGAGNKPVAYASLNGHALYAKAGLVLQGDAKIGIGIRNDTGKGKNEMDTGASFEVVGGEYLGGEEVVEPSWLNYMREWGPKISYDVENEIKLVDKLLPGKLRSVFENVVGGLPDEVLGEEGPTGPKEKDNWSMDERSSS